MSFGIFKVVTFSLVLPLIMAVFLQGGSCGGSDDKTAKEQGGKLTASVWGGDHIRMKVTANGAEIEYDCAHGSVEEEIVVSSNGTFAALGFHVTERPGPVREGEEKREAVFYEGKIEGETMTLAVKRSDDSETIGTYILTKGSHGRVRKCL